MNASMDVKLAVTKASTGDTIFCPRSGDAPLPSGYYGDLSSKPVDATPTTGEGSKDNTLLIVQYYCYSIS